MAAFQHITHKYFTRKFAAKWIGRLRKKFQHPRSTDLCTKDSFVREEIKVLLYETLVDSDMDLEEGISDAVHNVREMCKVFQMFASQCNGDLSLRFYKILSTLSRSCNCAIMMKKYTLFNLSLAFCFLYFNFSVYFALLSDICDHIF